MHDHKMRNIECRRLSDKDERKGQTFFSERLDQELKNFEDVSTRPRLALPLF